MRQRSRLHDDRRPLAAGDRDVQPVSREQKARPVGRIACVRRGHRHDRNRCLPPLELVDSADGDVREARALEMFANESHLRVVRRYDDEVAGRQAPRRVVGFGIDQRQTDKRFDLPPDLLGLLR